MRPTFVATIFASLGLVVACGDDAGPAGESNDTVAATTSGMSGTETTVGMTSDSDSVGSSTDATGASSSSSPTDPSSTSAADSSTGTDTRPLQCPDVGDPCTICESTQCPDEYCGCFDNGSCVLLAQCAAQCAVGDAACNQACWTQYPEGISDGALLTHCAATTCTADCGAYTPLNECQRCLYAECPDSMNGCVSNPECTALLECLDTCEDVGCENGCYAVHPDGLADSGPVGECAQEACLLDCA